MEIRRSHTKIMVAITTLFVLAIVVGGGALGYFWYSKSQEAKRADTSASGGSIALDTTEKVETETIQTAFVLPASTDKAGDTIKFSLLTMTTPKSWRTVNAKNLLNTPLESVYAESTSDILAQLVMVPDTSPTDKTQAMNSLGVYNITSWLKQPLKGTTGTITPATKAAYAANITALGEGKPIDETACKNAQGALNTTLCDTLLKPTQIASSDGKLKGIAYLATTAQMAAYDPQVTVFMTGQVKDQQIMIFGSFHLLDNNSNQLSVTDTDHLKATWDAYIKGDVPNDTIELYARVTNALKSLSIQE